MKSMTDSTDPAIMRLAHPIRCAVEPTNSFGIMREFLGAVEWDKLQEAFKQEQLASEILGKLVDTPAFPRLSMLVRMTQNGEAGTEVGNIYSMLLYLRHTMHPQPYFVIADPLVDMMENTDIADDIPASMVKLPYPRFFIEFGKDRTCGLSLPNIMSGQHILEGAYIEKGVHSTLGEGMFVLLTGSPIGKSGAMDDATHSLFIPLDDPNLSVKEALARTFKLGKAVSLEHGYRVTPDSFLQQAFDCLLFVLKTLLYINLPEARKELHKEKTEWLKATNSLQSTAKKAKAAKRGRGLVDHILIKAPPAVEGGAGGAGQGVRSMKQHWRRGHYRTQAHGPQFSMRKVIFVQPVLVHGDSSGVTMPQYKVT
jgi:hypothetical protein